MISFIKKEQKTFSHFCGIVLREVVVVWHKITQCILHDNFRGSFKRKLHL